MMPTIVRMTRDANITEWFAALAPIIYPSESISGRYQHGWSLAQREAWLRGRGERLRILAG